MKLELTDSISFEHDEGTLTITVEELSQALNDLDFLSQSALVLLNPKAAQDSDLPYDLETTKSYLKDYYSENKDNYATEFIQSIFSF